MGLRGITKMCLGATGLTSRKAIAYKARCHRAHEHWHLNYKKYTSDLGVFEEILLIFSGFSLSFYIHLMLVLDMLELAVNSFPVLYIAARNFRLNSSSKHSHCKNFSWHLEFFFQWKTGERKKVLPKRWAIGKRKDRGGSGAKKFSSFFPSPIPHLLTWRSKWRSHDWNANSIAPTRHLHCRRDLIQYKNLFLDFSSCFHLQYTNRLYLKLKHAGEHIDHLKLPHSPTPPPINRIKPFKRCMFKKVVFLPGQWGKPRLAPSHLFERLFEWRSRTNDDLSRLHGFEVNLHIVGEKLLPWRHGCIVSKINGSWMNFRSRYSLNRSKLRLCAKGQISTNFTLITSLLHSTALLQSYMHIGVKYQQESCGRQQKGTLDRRKEAERKVVYNW